MAGLLTAQVIGRLGGNAEIRWTQGGKQMCSFSVAADVGWGDNKTTQWVRCTLWGERGERLAQHLTKGSQVYIEGRLSTREWEGKDGGKRFDLQIDVTELVLLGGKREEQGETAEGDQMPF